MTVVCCRLSLFVVCGLLFAAGVAVACCALFVVAGDGVVDVVCVLSLLGMARLMWFVVSCALCVGVVAIAAVGCLLFVVCCCRNLLFGCCNWLRFVDRCCLC